MKKALFFIYLYISVFTIQLYAQNDEHSIENYFTQGERLLFEGKYKNAVQVFEEALTIAEKSKDTSKIAATYNGLSRVHEQQSNFREAFVCAEKALAYSKKGKEPNKKEEASALENLSIIQGFKGDAEASLKNSAEALEIRLAHFKNDKLALARSYFYNGLALHGMRNLKEATKKLDIALTIAIPQTAECVILHADIYRAKGHINYDLGKNNKALALFEKTLQLSQKVHENNNPYFGNVYNDIGLIYSMNGQYNESIEYYKKALSVSIHNYGIDNHAQQVRIHFNIGSSYRYLGIDDKALFHTNKTLELGTKFYGPNHPSMHYPYSQLGNIYGDERGIPYLKKSLEICLNSPKINYVITSFQHEYLADIYQRLKKHEEALEQTQKALEIRLKIHGKQNVNTIRSYNNVAKIYLAMKDFEKALDFNEKALKNNQLTALTPSNRFLASSYVNSDLLLEITKTKADIFLHQFKKTTEKKHLNESIKFYQEAASFIHLARKAKKNYQDKIKFSETVKAIYAKHIESMVLLNTTSNDSSLAYEAFYASEKSKAHTLRELLKQAEAKRNSNLHSAIIEFEQNINIQIAAIQSHILQEITKEHSDSLKIHELEGKIFDLHTQKDSLEKRIEIDLPKYYKLKYADTVIDLARLQENLNSNTTLVEFFSNKNILYAFIISKETFHAEKLSLSTDLSKQVELLNTSIISKDDAKFIAQAQHLYTQLIAPIKKHFVGDELIIIPDESLWHLQFDLLLTNTKSKDNEKLPYLLYEYAVSYANSASLLFDAIENDKTSNFINECVAFSFTSSDTISKKNHAIRLEELRNSQIDLPGTRKEIKEISNILDGTYFYGNAANEMNFKKHASTSRVLHLALHGDIDNNNLDNLKIHFSKGSPNDDDKLFGHELYAMHIPANLVVLSACNTGNGKVNSAEGIQSLGNAFQYAGAKSLLLSGWEISDKTTPEIMRQFYKNIKEGMPKHKALQQAKIAFLQKADTFNAAPFYWGSFYLLGNTQPIPFDSFSYLYWIISVSLFFIILFTFFIKKKAKKLTS